MSNETDPLLPTADDGEAQPNDSWKLRTSSFLKSRRTHMLIIALIALDAACVLADLSYTFLADQCPPDGGDDPWWLEFLQDVSLGITTLFLVELPLEIWTFGFSFYSPIEHPLHLFDAIIIIGTFVLETILRGRERQLAGLLILFRLWRLVRLAGGVAIGVKEWEEREREVLEEELAAKHKEIAALQRELHQLKSRQDTNMTV